MRMMWIRLSVECGVSDKSGHCQRREGHRGGGRKILPAETGFTVVFVEGVEHAGDVVDGHAAAQVQAGVGGCRGLRRCGRIFAERAEHETFAELGGGDAFLGLGEELAEGCPAGVGGEAAAA